MALTPEAWVIIAHYLLMHIVNDLDELQMLREQQRAQRGGHNSFHRSPDVHVQRGGHPISSIYFLAYSPYDEVEYVIDHEDMIVAEFICMLSDDYGCC